MNILKRGFYSTTSLKSALFIAVVAAGSACSSGPLNSAGPPAEVGAPLTGYAELGGLPHVEKTVPRPQATAAIDVRGYMAATIGGDIGNPQSMLCKNDEGMATSICVMGVRDTQSGEVDIYYDHNNGIVDHIAVTTWQHGNPSDPNARQYIGVIRNYTGNGGYERCFATWQNSAQFCTGGPYLLPDAFYMPEGVPFKFNQDLPVLDFTAVQAASNSDGSPRNPIAGALLITKDSGQNNYFSFAQWQQSNSNCQTSNPTGPYLTKVYVAYVTNVPFGGTTLGSRQTAVGTRDAFVVDTFGIGPPNIAERYFYAKGLGRVREGHAYWDSSCNCYDQNTVNVNHNDIVNYDSSIIYVHGGNPPNPEPYCPEGSAQKLWGYAPFQRVR